VYCIARDVDERIFLVAAALIAVASSAMAQDAMKVV
jgi:hypothetical protein